MKIALIDNYDSFTYNLAHLVRELEAEVHVVRNDRFSLGHLEAYDKLLLSPGPGIPSEAGLLCDVVRHYAGRKPILGICLGHQAIGEVFGATLQNLTDVFHGVATPCHILSTEGAAISQPIDPMFLGLPTDITVGRYHSWVVARQGLPACLEPTAISPEGLIMAMRHKQLNIRGIQFHPESVLTPDGRAIIANWLAL